MAQEKAKEDGYVKLERGFGASLLLLSRLPPRTSLPTLTVRAPPISL